MILNDYSEYYNQFGIYQTFSYNLSNPEAYPEAYSNMECFAKIING